MPMRRRKRLPNWTDSRADREGRFTPQAADSRLAENLSPEDIAAQIAAQKYRQDRSGTLSSFTNRPAPTVEQTLDNDTTNLTPEQLAASRALQKRMKILQGDQEGFWEKDPRAGWQFMPPGPSMDYIEGPVKRTTEPGPGTTNEWGDPIDPLHPYPSDSEEWSPQEWDTGGPAVQSFTYNGTRYSYEPTDGTWWVTTYDEYHQPQIFQYPTGPSKDPNFTGDPLKDLTWQLGNDGYWNFDDQGNATFTPNGDAVGFPEGPVTNDWNSVENDGGPILDEMAGRNANGFDPIGQSGEGAAAGLGGLGALSGVARDSSANNWYEDEGFRKWMQENVGEEVVRGIDEFYGYDDTPEYGRFGDDAPRRTEDSSPDGTIRSASVNFPSNPSWWAEEDDAEEGGGVPEPGGAVWGDSGSDSNISDDSTLKPADEETDTVTTGQQS